MTGTAILEAVLDRRAIEALAESEDVTRLDRESLEFQAHEESDFDYVRIFAE